MVDSLQALAFEEARRALEDQQTVLEQVRNRSTALVSVAAVTLGLAVTIGADEHKAVSVGLLALATLCFGGIVFLTAGVLRPHELTFVNDVTTLICRSDEIGDDLATSRSEVLQAQRDWAYWMREYFVSNQAKIDPMIIAYATSCWLLGAVVLLAVARVILLAVL